MSAIACFRSGRVGVYRKTPAGALPLIYGPASELKALLMGKARLAYDNVTWLVPGIPEAQSTQCAIIAMKAFQCSLTIALKKAREARVLRKIGYPKKPFVLTLEVPNG